jgi:hypothetical protein
VIEPGEPTDGLTPAGKPEPADDAEDSMPVTATADPSGSGVILATNKRGKVFRCTQLNCWHCFAKCPRRM